MIIVTGATGHLGKLIVENLIKLVPTSQVGVSVRDPQKASDLAALGIRVRQGDFGEPEGLRHAFEGATHILMISSNARASGGDALGQHAAAIDAAKAVGAQRIVYTSHMAASAFSAFPPAQDHAATEMMLSKSGLAWTALRHGFYAESGLMMMGDALKTGVIEAPADGKVSWTTHADLAEADAAILTDAFLGKGLRYNGPTPPLTSASALDYADIAAIASEVMGTIISRKVLSDEELKAKMAARGAPDGVARIALGLYIASRHGEFATVDPTLEAILGRRPMGMREVLEEKGALKASSN